MKFTAISILSVAGIVAAATTDDWNNASSASVAVSSTGSAAAAKSTSASTSSNSTNASTSSSSTSSGTTFQIPSGISSACSSFLSTLDQDASVQSCITPALTALSGSSPSISTVCAQITASTCSESAYYKFLTYFSGNCTAELITSPNADVSAIYDSLYVALPFQKAACTTDAVGNWCATSASNSASNSTTAATAAANGAQTVLSDSNGYPSPAAFSAKDILFLGYNSNMTASSLCTTCLQKVLVIYFGHESTRPYPSGLNNSPLMSVQTPLWASVQSQCPADFVSTAISNAGASPSTANAAPAFTPAKGLVAFMALLAGVFAL